MNVDVAWLNRTERVACRVNKAFPNPEFDNWALCEELVLSALAICQQVDQFAIETADSAVLMNKSANYLRKKANYAESEGLLKKSLEIWKRQPDYHRVSAIVSSP